MKTSMPAELRWFYRLKDALERFRRQLELIAKKEAVPTMIIRNETNIMLKAATGLWVAALALWILWRLPWRKGKR